MRYFQVIRILRALKHAQHNVLYLSKDLGTITLTRERMTLRI